MIFCKIWDERKARKKGDPYDFQIFKETIPRNATKEQIAKIELKISQDLYKRVTALYAEGKKKDPEVFRDDIRLNHTKVKTVVGYLESINLGETDLDSKGKAFETFMGSYFRGDFGQFFTPRPIVKFVVNSLPITNDDRVLDTSCGSGGFLLYALDKVRTHASAFYPDQVPNPEKGIKEGKDHYKHWHDFAEKNLFGIEINEQIARTAKMNMIIHDDGHTNVISSDGLLMPEEMQRVSGNREFRYNSFQFIITNPPFGSTIRQTEKAYLHNYDLGNKNVSWLDLKNTAVKGRPNQSTEILFIEQCWRFLEEGGFMAVVIPDGILTNSSLQYVRDNIEEWFRIVAVVSMPQTAFSHTGAGVKSSVLFLRKWNKATTENYRLLKQELQREIRQQNHFKTTVERLEREKKKILKEHKGFENTTDETNKKAIEKKDIFKEWKKEISDTYSQKINDLKEELADQYLARKKERLNDYSIFMAIAEDIGYDAAGNPTYKNELDIIGNELVDFIEKIDSGDHTLVPKENLENRIFIVELNELSGGRFDPLYYSKQIEFLFKAPHQYIKLKECASGFASGFGVGRRDQVREENGIIQIRPTNIDNNGNLIFKKNVFVPIDWVSSGQLLEDDDILFNNTNSQELVGKTAIYRGRGKKMTYSNHITVLKANRSIIHPQYLKYILNFYQQNKLFYSICTNWNNQSGVGNEVLRNLKIPVPKLTVQKSIVDQIEESKRKAEQLRKEAEEVIREAKRNSNQLILGTT